MGEFGGDVWAWGRVGVGDMNGLASVKVERIGGTGGFGDRVVTREESKAIVTVMNRLAGLGEVFRIKGKLLQERRWP